MMKSTKVLNPQCVHIYESKSIEILKNVGMTVQKLEKQVQYILSQLAPLADNSLRYVVVLTSVLLPSLHYMI